MVSHIGYPPELLDNSQLEKLHTGLNITPKEHFKNKYRASILKAGQGFKKLREPVDKMDWELAHISAVTVEAKFHSLHLSMYIPAAVLQEVSNDLQSYV